MAISIASSFESLKSNLEVTGLQGSTVSARQQHVREALARKLTVIDSFLTGSYARHTMIAPLSEADIDVFVVLDPNYYKAGGFAELLDRVRAVLLETYPTTPRISRNGQAVTVTFSDFVVDVVPGFNRQGGGYLIPSTIEKKWISTDPKAHVQYMSELNDGHDGNLVPLIKMVKAWNRTNGNSIRSFYLELLTARVLSGVVISDFPSGCRYVFDKGREQVKFLIPDPTGLGSDVRGLAGDTKLQEAIKRFEEAYQQAAQAEYFASQYRLADSIGVWRQLFGQYFPAYG
ncbi:MAG: CBASS oligonucleotide cyclase [Thermomicrobiales bacterium]